MSTYTNAFRRGQQVQCRGKLLASGKGPVTLIALAQAREKPPPSAPEGCKAPKPELRRSAVVAVDGKLALAQLMSAEEGLITPTSPSVMMQDAELQQLQLQVAAFLSPLNVSTLKSRFARAQLAGTSTEPPEPRQSQRTASAASASPASAPSEASSTATTSTTTAHARCCRSTCIACPSGRCTVSRWRSCTPSACTSRQLAVLPSADKLAL